LKDTIEEYDPGSRKGTGFTFEEYKPEALLAEIKKALSVYQHRSAWRELVKRVMELDFSWQVSAKEYIRLYNRIRS